MFNVDAFTLLGLVVSVVVVAVLFKVCKNGGCNKPLC